MVYVAVMGYGTVGSGVVDVLVENRRSIAQRAGDGIEVRRILHRHELPGNPYQKLVTHDFADIEQDAAIRVVVETIGGTEAAYEYTKRCLLAGKSVVTSNKELVATRGQELLGIAREKNVNYLFEASVGGGIPIIRPITQCLAANEITEIYGILNGTTNYILTRMIVSGASFADALREAQEMGYAERDPSADVLGFDACRKICILSDLCFGKNIEPEGIHTEGITEITFEDVVLAKRAGFRIKLLGRALRRPDGRIHVYVAPHLLREDSLLAGVSGVMNGIVVHGNAIGEAMFYGAGAGKRPTASAVVADVIDAAKHLKARKFLDWAGTEADFVAPTEDFACRWYVRSAMPPAGARAVFGDVDFIADENKGECAFLTAPITGAELAEKAEKAKSLSCIRILD